MVGSIFALFLLGSPNIDHSCSVGATSVYMDETYYHGSDLSYEARFHFDSHSWIFHPRHMHFHDKSFIYSIETGPEFALDTNTTMGIKAAFDLSNMSGRTFQQKSLGVEFSNDSLEISVRHYAPWPTAKFVDGYKIVPYAHTDLDILHKFGHHKIGFSPYHIEDHVGLKGHLEVFILGFTASAQWKYDDLTKHTLVLGISWGIFSPKNVSKHLPLIFTSSTLVAAQPSSLPKLIPLEPPVSHKKEVIEPTVLPLPADLEVLPDEKKK